MASEDIGGETARGRKGVVASVALAAALAFPTLAAPPAALADDDNWTSVNVVTPAHKQLMEEHEALKADYAVLEAEHAALVEEHASCAAELEQAKADAGEARSGLEAALSEADAAKASLDAALAAKASAEGDVKSLSSQLEQARGELSKAKSDATKARSETDSAKQKLTAAEKRAANAEAKLKDANAKLSTQKASYDKQLKAEKAATAKAKQDGYALALRNYVPTSAKLKASGKGALAFSWKALTGVPGTKYQVSYQVGNGKWKTVTVTGASRKLSGLGSGKAVKAKVRAFATCNGKAVYSPWSATVSAKTK